MIGFFLRTMRMRSNTVSCSTTCWSTANCIPYIPKHFSTQHWPSSMGSAFKRFRSISIAFVRMETSKRTVQPCPAKNSFVCLCRKMANCTRKNRRSNRNTRKDRKRQSGGEACPKGGNHAWKRINPKNMGGWCKCSWRCRHHWTPGATKSKDDFFMIKQF